MKQYFEKFKDLKQVEEDSLDDKLKVLRNPVSVLNVSKYDWVKGHLIQSLENISFPTDLITIVQNKDRFAENNFDIVYGMHGHDEGVTSHDEIGAFKGLGNLLIYSDCCHGKQGEKSRADVWVCDDYALTYTAWAIKDISEEVDEYLALGRNYNGIVKLALENKDLERAKIFAKISRFEIDDEDRNSRFSQSMMQIKGDEYKALAEILYDSGNKELILEHYEDIKNKVNKCVKSMGNKISEDFFERLKDFGIKGLAIKEHIELFERYAPRLRISSQDFDINELKKIYMEK